MRTLRVPFLWWANRGEKVQRVARFDLGLAFAVAYVPLGGHRS